MRSMFVLTLHLLTATCAAAQTFTASQDKIAVAVFSSAAVADWVTTQRNLTTPSRISPDGTYRVEFREVNPLLGWAADKPALMYTVAAGLDAGGVYAWYRLTTNHAKIRTVGLYAAAAARFALAYRNHQRREQFLKGH